MFKQLAILGSLLYASAEAKDPFFRGVCKKPADPTRGALNFVMKEDGTLLEESSLRIMKAQVTDIPNIEAIAIDVYPEDPLSTRTPVTIGSLGEWYVNKRNRVAFMNMRSNDLSLKTLPSIVSSDKASLDGMWIGVRDVSIADGLGLFNSCQISVSEKGDHDQDDDVFI